MRPADMLKQWSGRVRQLGPSRIALGLAVLFLLLALASPLWFFSVDGGGGDRGTRVYGWTTSTEEIFENGIWDRTIIRSYGSPGFDEPFVASTLAASYVLVVILVLVTVGVAVVLSLPRMRTAGPFTYLALSLFVIVVALTALFYPVIVLPSGLAADLSPLPIGGAYWGGPATTGTGDIVVWGAAAGWWLLFLAVILAMVGVALPYARSVRAMAPPGPRPWRPGR